MSFERDGLAAAVAAHGPLVRVVVARVAGSAPREAGAAMLVWAGGQSGTIGGGALELAATTEAREMLAEGSARRFRQVPLGPGLGQCCGGSVALMWERFGAAEPERDAGAAADAPETAPGRIPAALPYARPTEGPRDAPPPPRVAARAAAMTSGAPPALLEGWLIEAATAPRRPLWIYGAGHVGRALVAVLSPLPGFAITWVDTGPDRFPPEVPEGVNVLVAADPAAAVRHAPRDAAHLVLTYSHDIDLALCHALLRHGFGWAGLIGSETKWARFRSRLAALGHDAARISSIACPIGDPALGRHPQAIAVGVAAALLRPADQSSGRSLAGSEAAASGSADAEPQAEPKPDGDGAGDVTQRRTPGAAPEGGRANARGRPASGAESGGLPARGGGTERGRRAGGTGRGGRTAGMEQGGQTATGERAG